MIELALVNAPETLIRELKQQSIGLPAPALRFQLRQVRWDLRGDRDHCQAK